MSVSVMSVEVAAKKLGVHPRTVLRFINQGKLKASKIGRQWRIKGDDLNSLLGVDKTEIRVESSSVIDIPVKDNKDANRLNNLIMACLNSYRYGQFSPRVDFLNNPEENKVRIVLWGDISFMKEIYILLDKVL